MNDTQKPATSGAANGTTSRGFTDEERGAMKERAQELKAAARRRPHAAKEDGESAVLAKIAEMTEPDRAPGRAAPCRQHSQRASPVAEALVRDARACHWRSSGGCGRAGRSDGGGRGRTRPSSRPR